MTGWGVPRSRPIGLSEDLQLTSAKVELSFDSYFFYNSLVKISIYFKLGQ